ncbi:cell division protein ZapA [Levilactobacillus suantsaii]|uniref:Cell division protein ZapA n=1 Tax=Levilactobacillus suantsaii TaxID=2292255 RepID=A0A4Q0VLG5_9LACO|nr:cell division protein ZapA [Levilactobacillus suantsaii]QMU07890.1 cell division protein ZapA [Levilactobacillus suantsaii]RXI79771.1 cell division protein ZapA [Levilactobacillus suantsaii]
MTEQTHRFKAVIAGKPYTIVGQATDDHMRAVTTLLNEQFDQLKKVSPDISKEDAAVLMAFNAISDQLKMAAKAQNQQKAPNAQKTSADTEDHTPRPHSPETGA